MSIVERVRQLHFPLGSYVVIGSGTLDALDIREANDVDIAVLPDLYARLRASGEWQEEERYEKVFLMKDGVEINPQLEWDEFPTTTQQAIDSAMIIDDIPFLNLVELRKFKTAFGREKDYADIALIDHYLEHGP